MLYAGKVAFEFLPNIHLVGVLIVAITLIYRARALYSIYIFVFLIGLFNGFNLWWIPYLYIWTVLWALVMLIPKKLPLHWRSVIGMALCSLHGFAFGILYAPVQALIMGLNLESTIAWIVSGFPFDLIHGISNFVCGLLIYPIAKALERLIKLIK